MTEEKMQKGVRRGITLKQLSLILPLTVLFVISLVFGFYTTFRQKGDATGINFTGQLRSRSYELALVVNEYPGLQGDARDRVHRTILNQMEDFEKIIYGLRDGNKVLGLRGFKVPPKIEEGVFNYDDPWWHFDRQIKDYQSRIKPLVLHILKAPSQEEAKASLKIYNKTIPAFVGDVDRTAQLLQSLSEKKISKFNHIEFIILGLFLGIVGISFSLSAIFVRRPLLDILKGAEAFSSGNMDYRIRVKGSDEMATLARSFNTMAETIKNNLKEIQMNNRLLDEVLSNIGCFVRIVNPKIHKVTFQNKPLKAIFPQELERPCYSLLGRNLECERCTSTEAIKKNRDCRKEEDTPGGSIYEIHSFPLPNPDGTLTNAIEVIKDITAAKKMEKDLEESRMRLLESQKVATVGHLSNGIAHYLNNPLSGINLSADVLLKKVDEVKDGSVYEELKGHLAHIKVAAKRCETAVKDLLKISNMPKPKKLPTCVNEAVEHVLDGMATQLELSKIQLVRELSPQVPKILGSHSQLETAFMNIISNAIDGMSEGGTLTVKTEHLTSEDKVAVTIIDTSQGIYEKDLSHIFDPYFVFKIRPSTKCTGLELPLAQLTTQLHEGTIEANSEVGKGVTFKVKLPVYRETISNKAALL